jgi:hypothetical protein
MVSPTGERECGVVGARGRERSGAERSKKIREEKKEKEKEKRKRKRQNKRRVV